MKFIDGFWLLKEGVRPFYGLQVVNTLVDGDVVDLQVATRPIRHRGDTLGGPLLSVRLHSPTEGVIGVKIDHFKTSSLYPSIELFPTASLVPSKIEVNKSSESVSIKTAGLSAEVTNNPYTVTFKSPKQTLTFAGPKHQAVVELPHQWTLNSASQSSCLTTDRSSNPDPSTPPKTVRYILSELNISPGENFYGLGEQFGAFVKNGQSISVWNRDGGTSSEQSYKCVPFYISSRGYGVFINNPGEVELEIGSEKVSRVGISVAGEGLEYFLIYGETPLQILERYTLLTGRPALPPAWTFGLWLSTSFLTDYSSSTVSGFLQGMRDRNCNVRVFHLDCFWMKQYEWCSFTFDPENFPDPAAYLSQIKSKYGVKICVWINPYISQHSPIFEEAFAGGYLIKRSNGQIWQWDLWQPGLAIFDVTNPSAREWYSAKLHKLLDLGVDCFKTDFGERIPHANITYHNGADPYRMHNQYSVLYNELVFKLLEKRFGEGEAVVFARSAAAGGQRFPVHWGGDCESTFEAMAETLRGGLSLTLSGFAFTSHDIGGFEGLPAPEIYLRWVAYGLFSSHSRLHGSHSYRVPWEYGEEAPKVLAKFLEAKHQLMPYLYYHAIQGHVKGHPVQRATWLEFVEDCTTHHLDRQFMLGPSLLVAPVFVPSSEATEYYLPAGKWTSLWSERTVEGPKWIKEKVMLDDIPVWVRPGSLLILGPRGTKRPDYDYSRDLEVRVYELEEGKTAEASVPSGSGVGIAGIVRAQRDKKELAIWVADGLLKLSTIRIFLKTLPKVQSVVGAKQRANQIGCWDVEQGAQEVCIRLELTHSTPARSSII
ncbi:glycoside hydrolase family 31 protein [Ramaria rubella]|nr:glycoside hydrolase family 31 protein [Ramaria rubella]